MISSPAADDGSGLHKSSSHVVASREIDTHLNDSISLDFLFSAVPARDPDGRSDGIDLSV